MVNIAAKDVSAFFIAFAQSYLAFALSPSDVNTTPTWWPKVLYNNAVVTFGTPLLTLRVGDAPIYNRRAVYSGGSGTPALVFEYIVQVGIPTAMKKSMNRSNFVQSLAQNLLGQTIY